MRIIISFVLLIPLVLGPASSSAQTNGGIGTPACDFTAIKNSLYGTESAGDKGYAAINRRTGAAGKYQFMRATRQSYIKNHPECNGQSCMSDDQWISQSCWQVQECVMDAFTNDNLSAIRRDPACQQLLANGGQTITGSGQGRTMTCKVTESGLVAAFHLGGRDECRKILANGHGDNDGAGGRGGTDTAYYACRHGGLPVPGNCTPSSAGATGVDSGTATQGQVDFGGINTDGPIDPVREWWLPALMLMAKQFTVTMAAQVEAIGMFLDAKHQLETQRLFQQKAAEAHKDYQPSEQMCTFGTFARDLASSERIIAPTKAAVAERILSRDLGTGDVLSQTKESDFLSRLREFRKDFCDPNDNGRGLDQLCPNPPQAGMRNRDINYTQTLDQPLSLDIDLSDNQVTDDEKSVFALVDNLFATDPIERVAVKTSELRKSQYNYMSMRSIVAMRGVARNSIANIIALKTIAPRNGNDTNAPFLRSLLREFGLRDEEIFDILGENPSYYAQMEFLTKKVFQSPTFYTNLYDKPTNVKRMRAAMRAIKLMQDRDIQGALQRREMLLSILLELKLRAKSNEVYDTAEQGMFSDDMGNPGNNPTGGAP